MASNLDRYKDDLDKLLTRGRGLLIGLLEENKDDLSQEISEQLKTMRKSQKTLSFRGNYERWYSESLEVIRQFLPHRLKDFVELYKREKRKDITWATYVLSDYQIGLVITRGFSSERVFDPVSSASAKFQQQYLILESVRQRFESSLFELRQLVQADLFDTELDASKELLKNGFSRAAGAIAGVVIEKHLSQVC